MNMYWIYFTSYRWEQVAQEFQRLSEQMKVFGWSDVLHLFTLCTFNSNMTWKLAFQKSVCRYSVLLFMREKVTFNEWSSSRLLD